MSRRAQESFATGLPAFCRALHRLWPAVLAAALLALPSGCGAKSPPAKKGDYKLRLRELVKILKSEPGTEAAHRAAVAAAKDEHHLVRARAADALGELRLDPARSVELLTAMLSDGHEAVRATAALSLRDFGRAAAGSSKALLALLAPSEPVGVRAAAALALGSSLDPDKGVPEDLKAAREALAALLDDPEEQLKNNAIASLGELNARETLPRLLSMLEKEENFFLREACALALGRMGKGDPVVAEALSKIAQGKAGSEEERSLRMAAAKALWKADPENRLTVPVLLEALTNPEWGLGKSAREGLAEAGEKAAPFVAPLLEDEREETRALAAATLGDMGPKAFCAIPQLQKIASADESELARKHAREALFRITGKEEGGEEKDK